MRQLARIWVKSAIPITNRTCQAKGRDLSEDEQGRGVAIFFRDTVLSDKIGFHYQEYPDPEQAAADFIRELKERFAWHVNDPANRIASIILDGENAWGAYQQQARPFLHALYAALAVDPEIRTVTFREYLEGNPARHLPAHPIIKLPKVYDLFEASWIDENGSAPGNDLGTWIGEVEENRGWDHLRHHPGLGPDIQFQKCERGRHRHARCDPFGRMGCGCGSDCDNEWIANKQFES